MSITKIKSASNNTLISTTQQIHNKLGRGFQTSGGEFQMDSDMLEGTYKSVN